MDDCKGFVVLSLSGRDKNNTFVAVATDDGYAYCADGRIHPVASPKKKKLKRWQEEPKPRKGYYIARIHEGINPVTGYKYRHYTMIRINRRI